MGLGTRMRLAAPKLILLVALATLGLAARAGAQILPEEEKPEKAKLKTTGDHSELVERVPITATPNAKRRVAIALGPDRLPRLRAGDRIEVGGEVQVSTTCVARGPRCVGRRYKFNPTVAAQIVLAPAQDADAPSVAVSEVKQVLCKQRRPQRNHHCTIAFPNAEIGIGDPATLPCPSNACFVNMVVTASHPRAKPGNAIVLGADRPDGEVKQDKGRLNVIHSQEQTPAPSESSSGTIVSPFLSLNEGKLVKRRVVQSVEVPAPRKGELLAADGNFVATIDDLPFNTFLSTRIIVAETPTSVAPSGVAKSSSQLRGALTESNGFNCTQGRSGYATPCTTQKSGALRITRDAVDSAGNPVSVYVNLVAAAKPLLYPMQRLKKFHKVAVSPATGLRVRRFTPPPGTVRR